LAAASATYAAGVEIEAIQKGLNQFSGVNGRMTFLTGKNGSLVIDDTYNANLRSVLTALEVLAKRPGKKIVVFGDMGELGIWAESHHRDVGLAARRLGIDVLMSCGAYSVFASEEFGSGGKHFSSQNEIVQYLLPELEVDTTILVKGSRSSAMEKIVRQLLN
jgi:UDP-N-acetylmuramoyl-tripeptide--D-alanyl-D-alanine ligase